MKLKHLFIVLIALLLVNACQNSEKQAAREVETHSGQKGVVEEVIQAESYTYLRVKTNGEDQWLAVNKMPVETGETVYYDNGMEMKDFQSKTLQRTFDTIYFVQEISRQPLSAKSTTPDKNMPRLNRVDDVSVAPVSGGVTVAELYAHKSAYENKTVKIRGKVTKYNPGIMGRNWIHIQDGTSHSGHHDLTITTNASVKLGDVITVEGKIATDKDFGAGYTYEIIMESATLL